MFARSMIACAVLAPAVGFAIATQSAPGLAEPTPFSITEAQAESCTFALRAKNNMSFDVWLDLYDSSVTNHAVVAKLFSVSDLKIQNHRLSSGKSMDRRVTVSGGCAARRTWNIKVRIGGRDWTGKFATDETRGSGDRTVQLGNSSEWGL